MMLLRMIEFGRMNSPCDIGEKSLGGDGKVTESCTDFNIFDLVDTLLKPRGSYESFNFGGVL